MKRHLLARAIRATVGKLLVLLFRTRVDGWEHVPPGGALLAGNHVSYMDPVLLWCAARRPVHFMAKSELWQNRLFAWALPRLWSFPVDRDQPDRTAIQTATDLLHAGALVGVFPEGTRQSEGVDELGQAHGGAAFIALRANAPVVPVAFVGTERVWPRGARLPRLARTWIHLGAPIDVSVVAPDAGRKERVTALTAEMMRRIAEELEIAKGRS